MATTEIKSLPLQPPEKLKATQPAPKEINYEGIMKIATNTTQNLRNRCVAVRFAVPQGQHIVIGG